MKRQTEILDPQTESTTGDDLPDRERLPERNSRVVDGRPAIKTKDTMLDLQKELGAGISRGSLTLIEGHSSSGKSVLRQHLAYGALVADSDVIYYTSEHTPKTLSIQMASIGLGVSNYLGSEKLSIRLVGNTLSPESPELVAPLLLREVQRTPSWYKIVVVDSFPAFGGVGLQQAAIKLIEACHRLRDEGRTVILVLPSAALRQSRLEDISTDWDLHLSLDEARVGAKLLRTLEMRPRDSTDPDGRSIVGFTVEAGVGMQILPVPKDFIQPSR